MRALDTVSFAALAIGSLVLGGCGGAAPDGAASSSQTISSECPPPVPAAIAVPAGNALDFSLNATGVQIYQCQSTAAGPTWVFQAPRANLFDDEGELKVIHFAGPTWKSVDDGSSVVGKKVAAVTISPSAIPELLLQAFSHAGEGTMSRVTYVQRLNTAGGIAPASGCDASHVGDLANVAYTAEYFFYKASNERSCQ